MERILCAAIWYNDNTHYIHQPKNIETGYVVCGWRHHNCFTILHLTADPDYPIIKKNIKQGFLTSEDKFVSRKQAFCIAYTAGQIISKPVKETDVGITDLFSEDLY